MSHPVNSTHGADQTMKNMAIQLADILGIRPLEAQIFLLLNRLGPQNPHTVGRHLGINRTTMYSILENLARKQFIKKHISSYGSLFSTGGFNELEKVLSCQQKALKHKIESLRSLTANVPEIANPIVSQQKPYITHYEGLDQVKKALLLMLESAPYGSEILTYVNVINRQVSEFADLWPEYYKLRRHRKIFVKQISPNNEDCLVHAEKDHQEYRETRLVPFDKFPLEQNYEINILAKQFVNIYLNPTCPRLTIYHDEQASTAQRIIFDHHWQLTGPYKLQPMPSKKVMASLKKKMEKMVSISRSTLSSLWSLPFGRRIFVGSK